jgi:cytochrome c peroxidase
VNTTHQRSFVIVFTSLLCFFGYPANGQATRTSHPASASAFYADNFERRASVPQLTALGQTLFNDANLSASRKLSCASCHDPAHAFGPPNSLSVQRGGADGHAPGMRAAPLLTYTQSIPPFTEHFFDTDGNDSVDQGPAGGRTWDGRAQSAHDQARLPLLSSFEMSNDNEQQVVNEVASASYANAFRAAFGDHLFENPTLAFKAIVLSLEVFQQSPALFYPYTSKYDAFLRGRAALSEQEQRGLKVFNDANTGNCASCHPSSIARGALPSFTDYGYTALGVPRNKSISVNKNARFYDLGLCGPLRTDLATVKTYCGRFRTPSLRNVATRHAFFHNGLVHSLRDAVRFYAERDTHPDKWYPRDAQGAIVKFNDLPREYFDNIEMGTPFGQRTGAIPILSASDIDAIVAFLNTLTDGYAETGPQTESRIR